MPERPNILYCHCAYANVVPPDVKQDVLRQLAGSGKAFDAVADLCEMSAAHDPSLRHLAQQSGLTIAACFPRAVQGLFAAAGAPLPRDVTILNMRTQTADEVSRAILDGADASQRERS